MRWVVILCALLAGSAGSACAQVSVTSTPPRVFGWWLGDTLIQRVEIDLPEGASLEPASLPRPRSVDYWLDLRKVERRETTGGVALTLTWQNFYAALQPSRREVPATLLRLTDGTTVRVPGFEFVTSPIRPILAPSRQDQLQPDPAFQLVDIRGDRLRLMGAGTGALIALLVLAHHQAWWPFHRRAARPLTAASRRIARLPPQDADGRRKALHGGLDAAFGRVLISAELDHFLQARPEFSTVSSRLEAFFGHSDARFFGPPDDSCAPDDVASLAKTLAAIERGRR